MNCLSLVACTLLLGACTVSTTPTPGPMPTPSGSTPPATTSDRAIPDVTETDAGTTTDAGKKNDKPQETDITQSAECKAYLDKIDECGFTPIPGKDCAIEKGQCATSQKAYLKCQVERATWYCGKDGYSIIGSCKLDASLCD